jgi:hypothetical protein
VNLIIYMIDSDQHPDSNRRPFQILRSMTDLLVMVRVRASLVIGCQFETVRKRHRFENLKKGHRSEIQVSVT